MRHAKPAQKYESIDLSIENETIGIGTTGIQQAREFARSHMQKPFDVIICSEFARSQQTGDMVAKEQSDTAERIVMPELNEVDCGENTYEALKNWVRMGHTHSGETVADVRERVRRTLEAMYSFGNDVHGLLVGHRLLYSVWLLEAEDAPVATPVIDLQNNILLEFAEPVNVSHMLQAS